MGSEEDLAEQGTSSPAAGTSQVPQAAPLEASEDAHCPICLDTINDEAYVSWCKHRFCFPCIQTWARIRAVCPICRQPVQHIFHKVVGGNYEVHSVRRRPRRRSAERRRHRSSGRRHRSSPSRNRGGGHTGAPERGQSRSPRRHHDGYRRAQRTRGYNSSRSRRRQRRTARDAERDVLPSSRSSQRRPRAGRDSSRQRRATRSRSRRRSRSTGGQAGWERSRAHRGRQRWRSRDPDDDGRAPRSERDVLPSSRNRPSRRRSRSTWGRAQLEWQRRRYWDEGRSPSPEREVPAYSVRRERRQQGRRDSSREQRAARSRSRRRTRSRARRGAW